MTPTSSLTILPIEEVDLGLVLDELNLALGQGHTTDWFRWKHVLNPFGKSLGWVGMDEQGIAGIRLLMRWNLRYGYQRISALRPVDTVTAARARNRGVFRELTLFALEQISEDVSIVFNTPNAKSRPGYAKMGWTILQPIAHGYQPVWPGPTGSVDNTHDGFEAWDQASAGSDHIASVRSSQIMNWRYSPQSGNQYRLARLTQGDQLNGIVYRVLKIKGIRMLAVYELEGTNPDRKTLIRSVAKTERCLAVLTAVGAGALTFISGPVLRRGGSVIAVRRIHDCSPDPSSINSWALSLGDLERII